MSWTESRSGAGKWGESVAFVMVQPAWYRFGVKGY
jgi:hypothetical protein